jgi:hypothetical protein
MCLDTCESEGTVAVSEIDPRVVRRIADMHAVYRMYDEQGVLLYIGRTGNAGRRFGDHTSKRWFPLVATIKMEWLPGEASAVLAERRAIQQEHPRYNVAETRRSRRRRTRLPAAPPAKRAPVRRPIPEGECHETLTTLLARGTTTSEVALALGVSKWHARVRLERLRDLGSIRIKGNRRAAKWVLADETAGGDVP